MNKFVFLLFMFAGGILHAQFTINKPAAQTTDQIVRNILVGAGVNPMNIKFNGGSANVVNDQAGFWNTNLNPTNTGFAPLQKGMILTTGKVEVAQGPNNLTNASALPSNPLIGDPDLAKLTGSGGVNNVAVLEFDFVATGLELNFDFVFGSEEYPEYVGSTNNDAFGFFLSGPGIAGPYSNGANNIALIPGTNTSVTINNVNSIANKTYFVDNTGGTDLQYDGFTKPMRAKAALQCGGTYHIKLAIGQVGSNQWDSGVLLKNFEIPPLQLIDNYGLADDPTVCYGEPITIKSGINVPGAVYEWSKDGVTIPGNGPDLAVTAGGKYTLNAYASSTNHCLFASDDITIAYLPPMPINDPKNITTCTSLAPPYTFDINQTAFMLGSQPASDYTITYYDSSFSDAHDGVTTGNVPNADLMNYKFNGTSKTIWVRFEDVSGSGCVEVKSFDIIVNSLSTITGPLVACLGMQAQLTGSDAPATTNAWSSSNTAVATINSTGLVTTVSLGTSAITYTNSKGCSTNTTITVSGLPTATISGTTPVCAGTQTVITFSGTPTATVTYTVNGGLNQTIILDSSGTQTLTTPALFANSTYSLVSAAILGPSGCSQPQTGTATVNVLSLPAATISGTATVCQNDTAPIIFTGSKGIAPYTFTYKVNNGASQTVSTTSGNNATVSAPTTAAGSFVYELVSVTSSTTPSCSQPQTGNVTVNVTQGPNASFTYSGATFCISETSSEEVSFSGTTGGYYTATPTGLDIDAASGAVVPSTSTPGTYAVTYHVNPAGGCPLYDSSSVNVEILAGPTAEISYSGPYCVSLSGQVVVTQTGAAGGVYSATPAGLTVDSVGAITPSASSPGNYTVSYTVAAANGCPQLVKTTDVAILDKPQPKTDSGVLCLDPDTNTVMSGSTVTLDSGLDAADYTFEWYDSTGAMVGTQSTYQTNVAGEYTLTVKTAGPAACPSSVNMTVGTVNAAKSAVITVSNYFEDSKITIEVDGSGSYLYELDDSGAFQQSNVFTNVAPGTHTVTVHDAAGCTDLAFSDILIIDYPRFVTPNADGYNDTWNITSLKDQPNAQIDIFDRYGKLIKQLTPAAPGWDGTYNGYPLPSSDYWFTIKYTESAVEKVFKSHFALKR